MLHAFCRRQIVHHAARNRATCARVAGQPAWRRGRPDCAAARAAQHVRQRGRVDPPASHARSARLSDSHGRASCAGAASSVWCKLRTNFVPGKAVRRGRSADPRRRSAGLGTSAAGGRSWNEACKQTGARQAGTFTCRFGACRCRARCTRRRAHLPVRHSHGGDWRRSQRAARCRPDASARVAPCAQALWLPRKRACAGDGTVATTAATQEQCQLQAARDAAGGQVRRRPAAGPFRVCPGSSWHAGSAPDTGALGDRRQRRTAAAAQFTARPPAGRRADPHGRDRGSGAQGKGQGSHVQQLHVGCKRVDRRGARSSFTTTIPAAAGRCRRACWKAIKAI